MRVGHAGYADAGRHRCGDLDARMLVAAAGSDADAVAGDAIELNRAGEAPMPVSLPSISRSQPAIGADDAQPTTPAYCHGCCPSARIRQVDPGPVLAWASRCGYCRADALGARRCACRAVA